MTRKVPPVPVLQQNTIELDVFLDRSVIEVYVGGGAVSGRCLLPPDLAASVNSNSTLFSAEAFVIGGEATLDSLVSYEMGTMWWSDYVTLISFFIVRIFLSIFRKYS